MRRGVLPLTNRFLRHLAVPAIILLLGFGSAFAQSGDNHAQDQGKGGQAAHQKGTAHEFDSEEARRAGQKGGEVVSRNRAHMADIGRKGGESRQSANRAAAAAKAGNRQGSKES